MITLKPQHQTNVIAQLIELKSSIQYLKAEIAPKFSEMAQCEIKEYQNIISKEQAEFEQLATYIMDNQESFNFILSQYNLSCPVFICALNKHYAN